MAQQREPCGAARCKAPVHAGPPYSRRIADLPPPLRAALARPDLAEHIGAATVLCDACLTAVQPLPRTDVKWAIDNPPRSPLCAMNGWDCARQRDKETRPKHTVTLLPCPPEMSAYHRAQHDVPAYAARQCVCRPCYNYLSNTAKFGRGTNVPGATEAGFGEEGAALAAAGTPLRGRPSATPSAAAPSPASALQSASPRGRELAPLEAEQAFVAALRNVDRGILLRL
eukprot:gene6119-823_t